MMFLGCLIKTLGHLAKVLGQLFKYIIKQPKWNTKLTKQLIE